MELLITIGIAVIGGLWGIFKFFSNRYQSLYDGLETRVSNVEQKLSEHSIKIDHIEEEIREIKDVLSTIQKDVHKIDLNVARLIVLLEKGKGA